MKLTTEQLKYQQDMIDGGLPEIYAYMASQYVTDIPLKEKTIAGLLWRGFTWNHTEEGHDFWYAIVDELEDKGL